MKVLLVGGGAREHAIAEALCREGRAELHVVAESDNPGLKRLARGYTRHDECDAQWIARWAHEQAMEFAFVGPEEPLNAGVPDALRDAGVPTVGPSAAAARLETSKRFTRELMDRHRIAGAVEHHYFTDPDALARFLHTSGREWAIKPVGLTAGKGVRVMGVQLHSVDEAAEYGRLVIAEAIGGTPGVVVEERLGGGEFTLQAFVD